MEFQNHPMYTIQGFLIIAWRGTLQKIKAVLQKSNDLWGRGWGGVLWVGGGGGGF